MPSSRQPSPPPAGPLVLEGDLDIFQIRPRWEDLAAAPRPAGGTLTLDLSGAGDLDPSGMQLLAALARDLRKHGGRLELKNPPAGWQTRMEALGLAALLGEEPA